MSERKQRDEQPKQRDEQPKQRQRQQQQKQRQRQQDAGIEPSPPPYEVAETPLERLGPGFAYMLGIVGAAFALNLLLLAIIAGSNGG